MALNEVKLELKTHRRALETHRLDASQRFDHLNRLLHAQTTAALVQSSADGGVDGTDALRTPPPPSKTSSRAPRKRIKTRRGRKRPRTEE